MKKSVVLILIISLITSINAEIIINEVMPHNNNILKNEWIELYNNGSDLSLNNYKIGDNKKNYTLNNISIKTGDYLVIFKGLISICKKQNINCFVSNLGNGLNDESDNINLYDKDGKLVSSFTWKSDTKKTGKSFSFNGNIFEKSTPTPGKINININNQSSNQNNSNQNNTNNDNSTTKGTSKKLILDAEWDEEDIRNGNEFKIDITIKNLENKDYDLKVLIYKEDDSKKESISETYNSDEDRWISGTKYFNEFISGPNNKTKSITVRIKSSERNFFGVARIIIRAKEKDSSENYKEIERKIDILQEIKEETKITSSVISKINNEDNNYSDYQEYLEAHKEEIENSPEFKRFFSNSNSQGINKSENIKTNNIIYESANRTITRYSIYTLVFLSIVLLILIYFKRKTK